MYKLPYRFEDIGDAYVEGAYYGYDTVTDSSFLLMEDILIDYSKMWDRMKDGYVFIDRNTIILISKDGAITYKKNMEGVIGGIYDSSSDKLYLLIKNDSVVESMVAIYQFQCEIRKISLLSKVNLSHDKESPFVNVLYMPPNQIVICSSAEKKIIGINTNSGEVRYKGIANTNSLPITMDIGNDNRYGFVFLEMDDYSADSNCYIWYCDAETAKIKKILSLSLPQFTYVNYLYSSRGNGNFILQINERSYAFCNDEMLEIQLDRPLRMLSYYDDYVLLIDDKRRLVRKKLL